VAAKIGPPVREAGKEAGKVAKVRRVRVNGVLVAVIAPEAGPAMASVPVAASVVKVGVRRAVPICSVKSNSTS
jgi:hypothetical protein